MSEVIYFIDVLAGSAYFFCGLLIAFQEEILSSKNFFV